MSKGKLTKEGVGIWCSFRDLKPGDDWGGEIVRKIDEATCLVLLLSKNSQDSPGVRREVQLASERRDQGDKNLQSIIIFRLDDARLKGQMELHLAGIQALNENVTNWRKDLPELERCVRNALDIPPPLSDTWWNELIKRTRDS
jgi:hypothetical protein